MPDRDVFNRKAKNGWGSAARRMIRAAEDPGALHSVIHALGKELKRNGCPGIDEIVRITAVALRAPEPRSARKLAHEQLERVRQYQGTANTQLAVDAARRILAEASDLGIFSVSTLEDDQLGLNLACLILAHLSDASMYPAAVLAEIVEEGDISFQEVSSRRQHGRNLIVTAPEVRSLATQLLADSSGASVRLRRVKSQKLSQAEILVTALTE